MTTSTTDVWTDSAARIGRRLVASANWNEDECTWKNWVPLRLPGVRRGEHATTPGTLYQGTAGIALFLTELSNVVDEQEFRTTARGALRHAWRQGQKLQQAIGFHSGRVGIAYALHRFARITMEPEFTTAAEELLSQLPNESDRAFGFDVIGGAAGAIPVLLALSEWLPAAVTTEIAVQLGERIVKVARRGHVGWSWDSGSSAVRDLNGYAHGASGFAHALLELYGVTGISVFRYGAEQAMRYERGFFDAQQQNWPDHRHLELSEYVSYGLLGNLRERLRSGSKLAAPTRHFMTAWCHGAPGIGLTRLRACEILGDGPHVQEAWAALATTLVAVQREEDNFSLCHGQFGNCETLLQASRVLERPDFRLVAEERAHSARERFEIAGRAWPCGTLNAVSDPGLLMGEAGIGYHYLRLADDRVFSVLCPKAILPSRCDGNQAQDTDALMRDDIELHFGRTIRAFDAVQRDEPSVLEEIVRGASGHPPVVAAFEIIRERIHNARSDERPLLEDAFAVDAACYTVTASITDYSEELIDALARPNSAELDWSEVTLRLAGHVRIVRTKLDWHSETPRLGNDRNGSPGANWLVFRSRGSARSQYLSQFGFIVLESLSEPRTLQDVRSEVAEQLEDPDVDALDAAILAQLRAAYDAGVIEVVSPH